MLKKIFERERIYLYPIYLMDIVATRDIADLGVKPVEPVFCSIKKARFVMAYDDSYKLLCRSLFDRVVGEKDFVDQVFAKIEDHGGRLLSFCDSVKAMDVKHKSDQELIDVYCEYLKLLRAMRVWGWVPVFVDGFDQPYITDYVTQGLKIRLTELGQVERLNEIYSFLSSADKPSEVQQEEIARLKMLLDLKQLAEHEEIFLAIKKRDISALRKNIQAMELLEKHRQRFEWLTYAYIGPVMSLEHLLSVCQDTLERGDLDEQYQCLLNKYANLAQEKAKLIESLELSQDLVRLLNLSAGFMHLKDYRKGIYQQSYVAMDKVLAEISRRLRISLDELKFLLLEEVEEALLKGKRDYFAEQAKDRLVECCYLVEDGQIKIYTGTEGQAMMEKHMPAEEAEEPDQELRGSTAYPGLVRAIAKIILVAEDVGKLQAGEVLVSNATNPDLILAMKKAGAIVTDMGGITSHASIVARELQIPCVIGTRIATKVLKDGDMVEVDADRGKVNKLKIKNKNL